MAEVPRAIALYMSEDGRVSLEVRADDDTVWLTRAQLGELFGRDVKTIGKHVANARKEELAELPVVAKLATTAADGKTYQVEHYDLDMILAVGYRVKSPEGVHFRRWANDVLKRYVVEGIAINARRLDELGSIVQILARSGDELVAGVADVVARYLPGLTLLRDYDDGNIDSEPVAEPGWALTSDEARTVIARLAQEFPGDTLIGRERGDALAGIIGTI